MILEACVDKGPEWACNEVNQHSPKYPGAMDVRQFLYQVAQWGGREIMAYVRTHTICLVQSLGLCTNVEASTLC